MSKQVVENTKHIDKVYLFIGILMESGGLKQNKKTLLLDYAIKHAQI
jgi:hypothetical protein